MKERGLFSECYNEARQREIAERGGVGQTSERGDEGMNHPATCGVFIGARCTTQNRTVSTVCKLTGLKQSLQASMLHADNMAR